jgi:hypothetical protein
MVRNTSTQYGQGTQQLPTDLGFKHKHDNYLKGMPNITG